ncbi:MAG TPA: transglycosylase SLT domain-containing protein [Desulfomonilaceae bacterium]|nr:transglycosylase SLT domain-containing protein [Desulfomonilaceae bacterium]
MAPYEHVSGDNDLSPGGVVGYADRVDIGMLLQIFTIILFCLIVMPGPAHCMTVSSGPAQEYVFKEGKRYYDAGDLDRARATWENIFPDMVYGPVTYLLLARKLMAGRPESAETVLKEFLNKHPGSVYDLAARAELSEALYRQAKPEARALLVSMSEKAAEKEKPPLLLQLGNLEKRLGNYSEAASRYRTLYLNYPATVEGLKAADDIAWMVFHEKIPRMEFSETEQMGRASRLFAKGRFDLAADTYAALLKSKPADKELMLKLAQCRYRDRQNHKAINILKELLDGNISEKQRTEALYLMSLVYWRMDREKDFEFCCNKILSSSSATLKKKALFNLGIYNFEKHKFPAAQNYFNKLLAANPEPSLKATVKWKTAWIKYLNHEYGPAAEAFLEARRGPSSSRIENASKYWQARALMQANRQKDAESLMRELAIGSPLDYYGLEAARVLQSMNIAVDRDKKNGPFPELKLTAFESSNPLVSAAIKLMEIGLDEFALMNLEALPKAMKSSPVIAFLTARAAYRSEQYRIAREILSTAFATFVENPPQNAPAEFIEMTFPRVYLNHTTQIAAKHSVDPHLVWAVIRQESRYDPSAVSPAGALGLMQITPAAAGLARTSGKIPVNAIAEILDPRHNVALGIKMLGKNLASFKGKMIPAVASYNADIRKVREWLNKNGKMKDDEFIENMPYPETRIYVKKVLAAYRAYGWLYRNKEFAELW